MLLAIIFLIFNSLSVNYCSFQEEFLASQLWNGVLSMQNASFSLASTPNVYFINDTAVSFSWILNINDPNGRMASKFQIELTEGIFSDEFFLYDSIDVNIPSGFANYSLLSNYTVNSLNPNTGYQIRVVPIMSNGRGYPSQPISVQTLAPTFVYWEPCIPRRLSLSGMGRGFSDPVLSRPHLDSGVEIFSKNTFNNSLWYSDPATSQTPVLPSGRRGHSLSSISGFTFMFGGRTNGKVINN